RLRFGTALAASARQDFLSESQSELALHTPASRETSQTVQSRKQPAARSARCHNASVSPASIPTSPEPPLDPPPDKRPRHDLRVPARSVAVRKVAVCFVRPYFYGWKIANPVAVLTTASVLLKSTVFPVLLGTNTISAACKFMSGAFPSKIFPSCTGISERLPLPSSVRMMRVRPFDEVLDNPSASAIAFSSDICSFPFTVKPPGFLTAPTT